MNKLNSLSLFVGTGRCNADCGHCAGVPLRRSAPKEDGAIDKDLIYKAIKTSYGQGARRLSISSSGEPTLSPLSVTKTLELIYGCRKEKIEFAPLNLYSNGIRIGEDESFCNSYLPLWRNLGLTTIYITVHDKDEKENAKIYGIKSYPPLDLVLSRIHSADLLMRANIILRKDTVGTSAKFVSFVDYLKRLGVDGVSAWPIRGWDDKVDRKLSPTEEELDNLEDWVESQDPEHKIRLLREKNGAAYQAGQKLTLFPDGTLSDSWCNH